MSTVGKRIREYRTKRGYTQAQMADRLQMTEANFSSYERDKSNPPSDKLSQISSILDVSSDYLLFGTHTINEIVRQHLEERLDDFPLIKKHFNELLEILVNIVKRYEGVLGDHLTLPVALQELHSSQWRYDESEGSSFPEFAAANISKAVRALINSTSDDIANFSFTLDKEFDVAVVLEFMIKEINNKSLICNGQTIDDADKNILLLSVENTLQLAQRLSKSQ